MNTSAASSSEQLTAVVTGASSGIGEATVRRLTAAGWHVIATARRADRLERLAQETGAEVIVADLTDQENVDRLAEQVVSSGPVHSLIHIAGGAFGVDAIEMGVIDDWEKMYQINVLSTFRLVRAFIPALRASGRGDIVVLTSTAGHTTYEGGGGYTAAKHAEHAIVGTLRLELAGDPIRVVEIAPGLVKTEEFSLNRYAGDAAAAEAVYEGVKDPLTAEDVAETVAWAVELPHHVNIDLLVVRPLAQAAQHKVIREETP